MSDYLGDVEYGKRRGETVETPRGRVLARIPKAAARHEELGGLIGRLEAGLASLRDAVERNQAVLVILWERLGAREETIEELRPEERD